MAQLGNTIVNGALRVLGEEFNQGETIDGNLSVTTINGVTVGSSPKFTDTTYTFTGGTNKFTVTPSNSSTATTVTVTPSISNNVTGSGTNAYLAKFTGANTIGNGPQLGSVTSTFLTNKGTWAAPDNNKVKQDNTDTSNWRKVVLGVQSTSQGSATTSATDQVYVTPKVEVQSSTGTLNATKFTSKELNHILTGTGTAATSTGSPTTYYPAKWTFNTGLALTNGDIVSIKIPVAGSGNGVFLSIDNGTTYKPISTNGTGRLTTHYGANTAVNLIYDSAGQTNNVYAVTGATTTSNVTGGCWRVLNFYDSGNSNTYDRNRYNASIKISNDVDCKNGNIIVGKSGLYTHLKQGTAFDITYPILYLAEDKAKNNTTTNTYDIIYFTVTTTQSITLTAYTPVYIKGTLSGTLFTPVNTTPLMQTVPSSFDGYYYMLLGMATGSTTIYLQERHPIYKYYGGVFREYIHDEGYQTTASGKYSYAEGYQTGASSTAAHAEGENTRAQGKGSHAEGYKTLAAESNSHAEGYGTTTTAAYAHAEGGATYVRGSYGHAEGGATSANEIYSHTEGESTIATGRAAHAEGYRTTASNSYSHAEGYNTGASSTASHAEGYSTIASDYYTHAEGYQTTASGSHSHSEGECTLASSYGGHAEGYYSIAKANYSHAEGYQTTTDSFCAHAEGRYTYTDRYYSHAEGYGTNAMNENAHAEGHYNADMIRGGNCNNTTGTAVAVGNGTDTTVRRNAFSITFGGVVKAASTITASTTADYAEYFEWADENPNNEDRVGYFIAFDSDNKIKIGSDLDEYILGISSGEPFVLGNGDCDVWNGMVLRDEFRRVIYEPAPKLDEEGKPMYDDQGNPLYQGTRPKLNPRYDPTIPYINRADRPEWQAVGMLGVLAVRDNGACQINSYCTVASDGTAKPYTNGDIHKYRVIHRNSQNVIEIVFR